MRRPKSAAHKASHAGITRYLQLYTLLAQDLADGRFADDEPLPSEPDLVKLHGLSRTTVRRALERLEREGRIVRRRGSGTYPVQSAEDSRIILPIGRFCALRTNGADVRTLRMGVGPVPPRLRNRHSDLADRTHTTHRLHSNDGSPIRLEIVYSRKASSAEKIQSVRHEIGIVAADSLAARHLRVPLGTALLRLSSDYSGAKGRLVAVSESLVRADRAGLEATLVRRNGSDWQLKTG